MNVAVFANSNKWNKNKTHRKLPKRGYKKEIELNFTTSFANHLLWSLNYSVFKMTEIRIGFIQMEIE